MDFRKIKCTAKGKIEIAWEEPTPSGGCDQFSTKSEDTPRPEFLKALQALTAPALDICELSDQISVSGYGILGVSLSNSKHTEMVSFLILKKLKSVPGFFLMIETPPVPITSLDKATNEALLSLKMEAELYRNGERAQQTIL